MGFYLAPPQERWGQVKPQKSEKMDKQIKARYNDEILQIALDYVRLLTTPQIAEVNPGGRARGELTP